MKKKYRTPAENPMKFCERAVRGPRRAPPAPEEAPTLRALWGRPPVCLGVWPLLPPRGPGRPRTALSGGAGSLTRRRGPCRIRALSGHRRAFPLPSTAETRHDPGRCPWPVAASLGPGRRCPTDRSQTSKARRRKRVFCAPVGWREVLTASALLPPGAGIARGEAVSVPTLETPRSCMKPTFHIKRVTICFIS